MCVISAAFQQTQCSYAPCLIACVLACVLPVAILFSRSGDYLLVCIESQIREHGPLVLLPLIHNLNMALASLESYSTQTEQIDKWKATVEKNYEIQQRELNLLDRRDILDERRNAAGSLSPDEEANFQRIKIQLSKIRPQLWKNCQEFLHLYEEWEVGPWTMEFSAETDEYLWQTHKVLCIQTLGCCARSCGCCNKPRQGRNGRRLLLDPRVKTHCTIACACCEFWRESY